MIVEIEGVPIHLTHPDELSVTWVGQEEAMRQLLAAWLVIDPQDLPMNPRLLGKPGVGKTTLAYAAGKRLNRDVYIMQATVDTRPEDLLISPVIEGAAKLRYVASPLLTAMIKGGIAILDEGNRMSEKSWASLAPLLDNRRYVESVVTGVKIKAHPLFRMVATMNDDASTFDLPEYIHSRLQPQITLEFPERHEELAIMKENLPFGEEHILNYVTDFLQQAHAADERYTVRDGINIARFAMKLMHVGGDGKGKPAAKSADERFVLRTAVLETLGEKPSVMSQELNDLLQNAGSLRRGNITYFPVVPGRLEFAAEVRRRILAERPKVVAIELPESLEDSYLQALARLPEMSVILYTDEKDDDRAIYVPVEPTDPFTEAARTASECDAEVVFIEPEQPERPHLPDSYPDTYAIRSIGLDKYIEAYRVYPQVRTEEVATHAAGMAWRLQGADPLAAVFVVVSLNLLDPLLDAMQVPQDAPRHYRRSDVRLLNPHPDCLAEICVEYPFLQEAYELYRLEMEQPFLERPRIQFDLLREAEHQYVKNTGDKMAHWQRRLMARYTRNLASINGDLMAGVFDLTVAARSIVDDNFGWEVWQMANRYPAQKEVSDLLETVNLSGEQIWLNTKKIKLRRRLPRPKQRLMPRGLKPRKKEKFEGEWAQQTDGNAICSYPPEDLVIEDYGRFLKKRAKSMLSEERMRTEQFTTSILDGIDIRETIRNWHEGKIYVRQLDKIAGEVGAVVVIFDEDRDDRYSYMTTWLGENQNESDMAFYSTHPFEHLVGPGIGRAEYGGFLMALPPRRMYDVWSDRDYDFALNKPERLLMAGLDYSVQRMVVYVAAKPPRSIFRSIAAHLNRRIVYIPIGALSPAKLKKLRVVHVLDSYDRRGQAKDHIW